MAAPDTIIAEDLDTTTLAEQVGAVDILAQVNAIAASAMDVVTDTRILTATPREGDILLEAQTPDGPMPLYVQPSAHQQLAEKVGIPWPYYRRMLEAQPDLLATNLNRWFQVEPGRHMLRLLRPMSDDMHRLAADTGAAAFVRAVLSSRFRTIDHGQILNTVLPEAASRNLTLASADLTDTKLSLRFTGPTLTVDGTELRRGEVISYGVFIRNSETGHSSYVIDPFARLLVCLNGLIIDRAFRAVHVGRDKDDGIVSEQTQRLEDAAVLARARDRFIEVTAPEFLIAQSQTITGAMGDAIGGAGERLFELVDRVGVANRLTEDERAILQDELMVDLFRNTQPTATRFNLSQAVTGTAKRIYETSGDDTRREELERLGWHIMANPVQRLLKAGEGR